MEWCCELLRGQSWQVNLSDDDEALRARVPQAVVLTYHLEVEDPVLVRKVEAPEFSIEHFLRRRGFDEEAPEWKQWQETLGIDAVWFGRGADPSQRDRWQPLLPGTSLRGVFRSHCERILRTLSWHYAEGNQQAYEHRVAASDPLENDPTKYLCGTGQNPKAQSLVSDTWQVVKRGKSKDEERNRYKAGRAAAKKTWQLSDISERMFGSTLWRSPVLISEATVVDKNWHEQLFDHVAVERFSSGAVENKKFNALPITQATFEGKIVLLGDELWMLGLLALLFKDLKDGLVRVGSSKSRGYGKAVGRLTEIQVFALDGTNLAKELANGLQSKDGTVWLEGEWKIQDFPEGLQEPLKTLLCKAVKELNEKVQAYKRPAELRGGGEGR